MIITGTRSMFYFFLIYTYHDGKCIELFDCGYVYCGGMTETWKGKSCRFWYGGETNEMIMEDAIGSQNVRIRCILVF
jgi:hypothetical protein